MSTKIRAVLLSGLCFAMLNVPVSAQAGPVNTQLAATGNIERDVMIVRIATGQAEKKAGDSSEWLPLAIGADLGNDDTIKTGKNSTILLELPENAGFIRLLPETEVKVNQIKVDRSFEGGQIAELSVSKGKVITKVRKFNRKSSRLQIHTKGATAAVRGTSFLTSYNDSETKVVVGDGKVAVKAQGEEVIVQPREFTMVGLGSKPLNPGLVGNNLDFAISAMKPDDSRLSIAGSTDPDAEINLNKIALFPNNDGTFNGNLSLREGENNIAIKVSTIDGRQKTSTIKVLKFTE